MRNMKTLELDKLLKRLHLVLSEKKNEEIGPLGARIDIHPFFVHHLQEACLSGEGLRISKRINP